MSIRDPDACFSLQLTILPSSLDLAGLLRLIFFMVPKWQWQFQQLQAEKMLLAITLDKLGKPHVLWARMASHAHDWPVTWLGEKDPRDSFKPVKIYLLSEGKPVLKNICTWWGVNTSVFHQQGRSRARKCPLGKQLTVPSAGHVGFVSGFSAVWTLLQLLTIIIW